MLGLFVYLFDCFVAVVYYSACNTFFVDLIDYFYITNWHSC